MQFCNVVGVISFNICVQLYIYFLCISPLLSFHFHLCSPALPAGVCITQAYIEGLYPLASSAIYFYPYAADVWKQWRPPQQDCNHSFIICILIFFQLLACIIEDGDAINLIFHLICVRNTTHW